MSEAKYKNYQEFYANYLGGWSFANGDQTLTIRDVYEQEIRSREGTEVKPTVYFEELDLPLICNKTNAEAIAKVVGSNFTGDWIGKRITIGTERIRAFSDVWDAIRVRPEKPEDLVCERCGQPIKEGKKLALQTQRDFGQALCLECARKAKAERDGNL